MFRTTTALIALLLFAAPAFASPAPSPLSAMVTQHRLFVGFDNEDPSYWVFHFRVLDADQRPTGERERWFVRVSDRKIFGPDSKERDPEEGALSAATQATMNNLFRAIQDLMTTLIKHGKVPIK